MSRGKMLFLGNYPVGQRSNGPARRGVANRDRGRGGRGAPNNKLARARADGRAVARVEVQMVGGHLVLLGFYNTQSKQIQLDLNAPSKPAYPEMREGLKALLDRFQALGKRLELEAFLDEQRTIRLEGEAALDKVTRDILESLRQQKEIRHTVEVAIRSSHNVATGNRVPASFTKRQRDDAARKKLDDDLDKYRQQTDVKMKALDAKTLKKKQKLRKVVGETKTAEKKLEKVEDDIETAKEKLDHIRFQQNNAFDEVEQYGDSDMDMSDAE